MQRAGHKRPKSLRAIPAARSVTDLNVVAFADAQVSEMPVDVVLLPNVNGIVRAPPDERDDRDAHDRALALSIHQRIESRLFGRVKNLHVRAFNGVVVLEGQCATYYTKQLAQHAAMGVLEDEHLENSIVVSVQ
jgi:osmotically-inducible protein OsmY